MAKTKRRVRGSDGFCYGYVVQGEGDYYLVVSTAGGDHPGSCIGGAWSPEIGASMLGRYWSQRCGRTIDVALELEEGDRAIAVLEEVADASR